uniref:Uncharacterized protein n=1 Tax=Anolis carolinensis TaxID=28377 RepID=A0A803T0B8_ANOCA
MWIGDNHRIFHAFSCCDGSLFIRLATKKSERRKENKLPRAILVGSLILGTGKPADLLLMLESMLLVLDLLPAPLLLLDLLGLGKLRY